MNLESFNFIAKKNKSGITLIALVVTVIVILLIARNYNYFFIWRKSG